MVNKANLNVIKIEAHHCYRCGSVLTKENKTLHHAIQECFKPERNILIPVCKNCHKQISFNHIQSSPKFKNIKGFLKNLEEFLNSNKKIIQRCVGEEENVKKRNG